MAVGNCMELFDCNNKLRGFRPAPSRPPPSGYRPVDIPGISTACSTWCAASGDASHRRSRTWSACAHGGLIKSSHWTSCRSAYEDQQLPTEGLRHCQYAWNKIEARTWCMKNPVIHQASTSFNGREMARKSTLINPFILWVSSARSKFNDGLV